MNLKTAILTIAVVIVASQVEAADIPGAVELGQISVRGSACTNSAGTVREVQPGIYDIPLNLSLTKALDKSLDRGTCAFALPIQVSAGHRLILSDVVAKASLNLRKGNKSRLDLEIFKAGSATAPLTAQHDATAKKIVGSFRLARAGEIVALECGESAIIRGNAAAVLQGAARSIISLNAVRINARLEKCL